ncbi:hypothetical protein ACFQYP_02430 [Nonomuraea antimicrobica]
MKLAIRRTYLGDRLCFPDVVGDRLVDVQAAYARMLETRGSHRDDAIPRSRREIAETLPQPFRPIRTSGPYARRTSGRWQPSAPAT